MSAGKIFQMSSSTRWSIVSIEKSRHRERFSSLLQDIEEAFIDSEVGQIGCSNSKSMVLGLDALPLLDKNIHPCDVLFVSLAYDLEDGFLTHEDLQTVKSMAQRGSRFIVDCQSSYERIISKIHTEAPILKVIYGADIDSLLKIPFEKGKSLEIICTRTWNHLHDNFLLIEALNKLPSLEKISIQMANPGDDISSRIRREASPNLEYSWFEYYDTTGLIKLLSENWMYVSTSPIDGASISLMEALSAGRICLVSNIDANREFIEDGQNGFLFETNNAESLSVRIKEINELTTEHLLKISNNARATARQVADWKLNSKIIKLFVLGASADIK